MAKYEHSFSQQGEIENKLLKRASHKRSVYPIGKGLVKIAEQNGDEIILEKANNLLRCGDIIAVGESSLHGYRCKLSICLHCNEIKKVSYANNYKTELDSWEQGYLLTIQTKALSYKEFSKNRIDKIISDYSRINSKARRKWRKNKVNFKLFRGLELALNMDNQTIMAHYHVLTPDLNLASYIKELWKIEYPNVYECPEELKHIPNKDLMKTLTYLNKGLINHKNISEFKDADNNEIHKLLHKALELQNHKQKIRAVGDVKKDITLKGNQKGYDTDLYRFNKQTGEYEPNNNSRIQPTV